MANGTTVDLQLLGQFTVRVEDAPVRVPATGQRVIAGIALHGGMVDRGRLAGTLWPNHRSARAFANLRGAICRLPSSLRAEVLATPTSVSFTDCWAVDLDKAAALAKDLHSQDVPPEPDCGVLGQDLLPDWTDDWLIVQRERHRQLRLHALEDLARRHLDEGDALTAVDTALAAVTADELRESAQFLLMEAHLRAGNRAAAASQFRRFRGLLQVELGVDPSPGTVSLVSDAGIRI